MLLNDCRGGPERWVGAAGDFEVVGEDAVGVGEGQLVEDGGLGFAVEVSEAVVGCEDVAVGVAGDEVGDGGEEVGVPEVVGVEEGDVFASGLFDAPVTGGGDAGVRLGDEADAGIIDGLDGGDGVVGGAIVDDDHFVVCKRLGEH